MPTSATTTRIVHTTVAPKPTRSEVFRLRLSPAENATLRERAQAAGLAVAEYVRRECGVGHFGRSDLRRSEPRAEPPEAVYVRPELGAAHKRRVQAAAQRMPQKNAERLVRREEAREKAKEAVGS